LLLVFIVKHLRTCLAGGAVEIFYRFVVLQVTLSYRPVIDKVLDSQKVEMVPPKVRTY